MKGFMGLLKYTMMTTALVLTAALPARAVVNDSDLGMHRRGAVGGGAVFMGYNSYGSTIGDVGTGSGAMLNMAAMLAWKFIGVEGNIFVGSIGDLEWDAELSGTKYTYTSKGSGSYMNLDLKLGFDLFREEGDMGYTFIYAGPRYWRMDRKQDSFEVNGMETPVDNTQEAKGSGWTVGFRDFSTIGPNDGFAVVLQTGLFAGTAPVDKLKWNNYTSDQKVDQSLTIGGELALGVALQNIGFSVVGGLRTEANVSVFKDPTTDDESAFGLGNVMFFVEAGLLF